MLSHQVSIYQKVTYPYVFKKNVLDSEELNILNNFLDTTGTLEKSKTVSDVMNTGNVSTKRNSFTTFIDENLFPNLFVKLDKEIDGLNQKFYNFKLDGYDSVQLAEYKKGCFYNEHLDMFLGAPNNVLLGSQNDPLLYGTRKLSGVILLSKPTEFEGGQFQMNLGYDELEEVKLEQGMLVLFPSFFLHQIKTITKGTRRSLVFWINGPKFI